MRRRHFLGLAGIAGLASYTPVAFGRAPALQQVDPRFEEISELVERTMATYRTTGVALGISKAGVRNLRGFGLTNVWNPQPVTPDTVFPIASISKTVTGTAVMRLRDRGQIDIEAPVTEYLPGFEIATPETARDLRIWHLLTHTPGWHGQLPTPDRGPETFAEYPETLREVPALARPGEVWSYHNSGWALLGTIIERVTGQIIHEALRDLVFDPLGLERATGRTGAAMTWRFAAPHREQDGRTVAIPNFQLPSSVTGGGCAMSLENIIRYAEFHLGDGTAPSGERLMSQASLELMRTARITKNTSTDQMGLGWHLRTLDGVLTGQHGGTLGGHRLHLQIVPERQLCFAILTNHQDGDKLNEEVATAILRLYEDIGLAPGQRTGGNRGGTERMHLHAQPLDPQPDIAEYVGAYAQPPRGTFDVSARNGGLVIGIGQTELPVVFWSDDMTYVVEDGVPFEFIRDETGAVTWLRGNGRIARREGR